MPRPELPAIKKPRRGGADYREQDKPFVAEMRELMADGVFSLRALARPSLLATHRHILDGIQDADQCLLRSDNGVRLDKAEPDDLTILRDLRVTLAPPAAVAPSVAVAVVANMPRPELPAIKKPRRGGADYREQDKPFVAEMRELIRTGQARNVLDAARAVAPRAGGQAAEAGKVDRLRKRYAAAYPATVEPVEPAR